MSDEKPTQPTQPTQPKKGDPVQIPVPSRDDWLRNMRKVAPPAESKRPADDQPEPDDAA